MKGADQRCRTVHACTDANGEPVKPRVEPVPDSLVSSMVGAISNIHGANVSPPNIAARPVCIVLLLSLCLHATDEERRNQPCGFIRAKDVTSNKSGRREGSGARSYVSQSNDYWGNAWRIH